MSRLRVFSLRETEQFFRAETHARVSLREISGSRVLWLNRRVIGCESSPANAGSAREGSGENLLRSCGYGIAEGDSVEQIGGVADRYGGVGIGSNGGSGRAAFVNGYYVKGIGRTPLVGRETEAGHASGGAYLEECVKESILSELVDAEFPHGSVPTLGIIDTGATQVWEECHPPKVERRCLLVRPCFLRPAHFERAVGFLTQDEKDGYRDTLRVAHMFKTATEIFGRNELLSIYRQFWLAWAEQLAYAFVHRLPHGGDSTSNIALDGRLLDFGAMTSVPSWARISLSLAAPPVGDSVACLMDAIAIHAATLGRYVNAAEGKPARIAEIAALTIRRYQCFVLREMLRVAGLTRTQAERLLSLCHKESSAILGRVLNHFRREQFAIFAGTPQPRIPWDVDQLWTDEPPEHLRVLREFLARNVDVFRGDEPADRLLRGVAGRCAMRARTRPDLYRKRIKEELFRILETELSGDALDEESLERIISATVCRNRRDCKVEPGGAVPIGFARNARAGYALFRCLDTTKQFAIKEWDTTAPRKQGVGGGRPSSEREPKRHYIAEIRSNAIAFASSTIGDFVGSVWLL